MRAKLRRVCVATLGLALLGVAGPGQSQPLEPAAAIAVRRDGYRELGAAFKNLNDELKKPKPLISMIKRSNSTIVKTVPRAVNWFPAGSGPSSGIKTAAKADIWSKRADFDSIQRKVTADTAKLDQLVAGGDLKAIAAQAKIVGGDCKACHDKYREKED